MEVRTRFAPSPTGYLHLGGLRTALYTYLYARRMGGKFILRIEDTDQEREVPGAVQKIYDSLRAAGLNWDEGPDVGGPCGPYIQTQRKDMYLPYAKELVEKGAAYYCFCTKERLDEERAKADKEHRTFKYDKHCMHLSKEEIERRIAAGEPYVIRQNIPTEGKAGFDDVLYGRVEVDCSTLDDNVLIKADGLPTYNFANVVDDHLMGITHVTRGTEYLSSAPKYNLLYEAFGWQPPIYVHLPPVMREDVRKEKDGTLIPDEDGNPVMITRKLSKRYGDPSFEDLLDQGYITEAIINFMCLIGWSPRSEEEFFSMEELEQRFDLEGINKAPGLFDMQKLTWFNAEYTRRLSDEEFYTRALPWMAKAIDTEKFDTRRIAALLKDRTEVFDRIPAMIEFLGNLPEYSVDLFTHKKMKTNAEISLEILNALKPVLEGIEDWSETNLHDTVMAWIAESGRKNGTVLWPLRIAVAGVANTPGGAFEILYLLGKEESMRRIDVAFAKLNG